MPRSKTRMNSGAKEKKHEQNGNWGKVQKGGKEGRKKSALKGKRGDKEVDWRREKLCRKDMKGVRSVMMGKAKMKYLTICSKCFLGGV